MMRLPGWTLASKNCCRLSAPASCMTPRRTRPRPLGGVEFHRRSEQHLAHRAPAGDARFGTTQEGLVDLHVTGEPVPTRAHHDRPVAMQHGPGSLVGAKLHLTLKLGRGDAA